MFSKAVAAALACALLLTPTAALPPRTHCRCSITSTHNTSSTSPPAYRDSLENPDTLIPPTLPPPDLCAALGPALESLRHADPALYASYVSRADTAGPREQDAAATSEEKPIPTTILLRVGAQPQFQNLGLVFPAEDSRRPRPRERIECKTAAGDDAAWPANHVSWVTLVVMQLVVAMVVVACVAEGIIIGAQWMALRGPSTVDTVSARPSLRLGGEERRLLAVAATPEDAAPSPGVDKKMRLYASPGWNATRYAYMEDEDDEFNRPVM